MVKSVLETKLQSYKEYIRAQWLFNIQIHLQLGWNFSFEMWDPCEVQLNFGENTPILSMVTFNIHVHLQFDWISQEWNLKSLVRCKLSFQETCESKWLNFSRAEWEIIVRCGSYSEIINFDHGDFQYTNSLTVELNFSRVKWEIHWEVQPCYVFERLVRENGWISQEWNVKSSSGAAQFPRSLLEKMKACGRPWIWMTLHRSYDGFRYP
jgi:hypothetical protein